MYTVYIYIYSNFEIVRIGELKEIFNSNQFVHFFRIEPRRGSSLRFLLILDEREREREIVAGFTISHPFLTRNPLDREETFRSIGGESRVTRASLETSRRGCAKGGNKTGEGRMDEIVGTF